MGQGRGNADGTVGMSRRAFLIRTAAVAAVAVVPMAALEGGLPAAADALSSAQLRRATFSALLHQRFHLVNDAGTSTTVTLTEIDDLQPEPNPGSELRFSLLFSGTAAAWPQGIYQLQQAQLGSVDLLVVPVGMPGKGTDYQIIVNNPG